VEWQIIDFFVQKFDFGLDFYDVGIYPSNNGCESDVDGKWDAKDVVKARTQTEDPDTL
jgi:hypothetical protein